MTPDAPPQIIEYGPSFRSLLGGIGFTSDGSTWVAQTDGIIRITRSGRFTQKRRPDDCWYRCYNGGDVVVANNIVWSGGYAYVGTAGGGIAFARNPAVVQSAPPYIESTRGLFGDYRELASAPDGARWTVRYARNGMQPTPILTFQKGAVTRDGLGSAYLRTRRIARTLMTQDDSLIVAAQSAVPVPGAQPETEIVRISPRGDVTRIAQAPRHEEGWAPAIASWTLSPAGDIWLTEWPTNRIARVTLSGQVTEYQNGIPASMQPNRIAVDARGNVWFDDRLFARVARLSPDGTIRIFGNALTPWNMPGAVVATSDGAAWFMQTLSWHTRLTRIASDGTMREFTVPPLSASGCVTRGNMTACWGGQGNLSLRADGPNVDVLSPSAPSTFPPQGPTPLELYTVTPDGRATLQTARCFIAQLNFVCPAGLPAIPGDVTATYAVIGADRAVWFSDARHSRIGRLSPGGAVRYFSHGLTQWNSGPQYMTLGRDGAIWFTEIRDRIGRITPDGTITEYGGLLPRRSFAGGIATGCDGNLWFTLYHGNELVRMKPDHTITRFRNGIYPSRGNDYGIPDSYLYVAADGRLWFNEPEGGRIAVARIDCR